MIDLSMVILQVLPALEAGGVERGTVDIAAALTRAGHSALVASNGGRMVSELEETGATHFELPVHSKNPLVIAVNASRLSKLIEKEGVDLVHARSRASAWPAMAAARRTGRALITTFHGAYPRQNYFVHMYNSVMAKGDRVIAVSSFIARCVRDDYNVGDDRLVEIYRGIDCDLFDPASVSADRVSILAAEWNVPLGAPIVLLPGRMTRLKGQAVLVRALGMLKRRDVYCLLVGAWKGRKGYARELKRLAESLGVMERLRIVGGCSDMPAAYKLADVVVSASTQPEACPRVTAEAIAMERAVVATDHGGGKEIIETTGTGWLAAPGDPKALADAISRALESGKKGSSPLRELGRAIVKERYSLSGMCSKTLKLYAEAILGA